MAMQESDKTGPVFIVSQAYRKCTKSKKNEAWIFMSQEI